MPKTRIYELAKELNVGNKAIIEKLETMNIAVKSHSSTLDDSTVATLKSQFSGQSTSSERREAKPSETPKAQEPPRTSANPVQQQAPQAQRPGQERLATGGYNSAQGQNRPVSSHPKPVPGHPRPPVSGQHPKPVPGQPRPPMTGDGQRPAGQSQSRPPMSGGGDQTQRPQSQGSNTSRPQEYRERQPRSTDQQQSRPQGQGYGQSRPQGQGYGQSRPQGQGYGQSRPQGQGYGQSRPQGQGYGQSRSSDQQQRQFQGQGQGQGGQNRYQGQGQGQAQGQGGGYRQDRHDNGQRPAGQGGQQFRQDRQGGQGGQQFRPAGQGGPRPQRPAGAGGRPQGGGSKTPKLEVQRPPDLSARRQGGKSGPQTRQNQTDGPSKKGGKVNDKHQELPKLKALQKPKPKTKLKKTKPEVFEKPVVEEIVKDDIKMIALGKAITVKDFSAQINVPVADIIKRLMKVGIMANVNQEIDFYTASKIAEELDIIVEKLEDDDLLKLAFAEDEENDDLLVERSPVVVVMGHVDHGKTSLLDAIRDSKVTASEAGGITQHIGAYTVSIHNKPITFLDTPGHEAFTAMRMRGAQVTDIAILVVAADDGVMPQTIEAINHAKAAGVEIIVAINKIDKVSANPDRVKQELTEYGLLSEDWGGETICAPVSALSKEGIDHLLEMINLVAEMKELKANPQKKARGTVIEALLDKGRGPVATVLVQNGTLRVGDPIVAGSTFGKIRAMTDDKGRNVKAAGPSTPVAILGLSEVPHAGDAFYVTTSDKQARQLSESVVAKGRAELIKDTPTKVSLDDLFSQIQSGNVKDLNIVVKADVQGSVEAVKNSLERLSNDEVRIRTIHGGVGAITESDVMLASASNAIIIGFNVRPEASAKSVADLEKVDVRLYRIIYNAIEDITAAMKGMLAPVYEEKVQGHAEIRQLFKASGVGTVAGSYVTDGKFTRNSQVRIIRDGIVIYDGTLATLKRFKDDVKEVNAGYECGLLFQKFNDIKEGDKVEAYVMEEIPR